MAGLFVRLFGLPEVRVDGKPLSVDTRKAVALLAYLAVTGQKHSRESLAALLWPESDGASARAALRRTLSALRGGLGGRWLTIERDAIGLETSDADIDVAHARELIRRSRAHEHPGVAACRPCLDALAEAAQLFAGDFMSGFSLRDSAEFDDWQAGQAASLRDEFAGVLDHLVEGCSAMGRFDEAVAYAKARLALDPLQESSHQALMRLHAWRGDRSAALRQYRECVRVLDRELGVPVLEETAELYRCIIEDRLESPKSTLVPPEATRDHVPLVGNEARSAGDGLAAPPMVGRAMELAQLTASLEAPGFRGQLMVIEGEAGIGKSRLLSEFVAQAWSSGRRAVVQRCFEGEAELAYAPVVQALRAAIELAGGKDGLSGVSATALADAAWLLPELAPWHESSARPGGLEGPGGRVRFYHGLAEVIFACIGSGGVLAVDDVHWADDATLDFLSFVAHRFDAWPLMVVVTWRSEGVAADHRLRAMLADAERGGHGLHIGLGRLSADDVRQLLTQKLDTASPGLARRLFEDTEGLPLFVVEYLAAIGWSDPGSIEMPANVQQLLRQRVAGIGEASRQLLTAAAVLGRSFPFDLVKEVSGRSEGEAVDALDELISRRLVVEVARPVAAMGAQYDFYHDRLRDVVYSDASFARRRLLHRRAADALKAADRGRADHTNAATIAQHLRQAGEEAEAATYYRKAGDYARSRYANTEALSHFETALALGHREEAELHEAIGDLQTLAGRYGAALRSYETAAAVADPGRMARLEHKLGGVYNRLGDWELAERQFEEALAALEPAEEGLRARVCVDLSLTFLRRGNTERAQELAEEALLLAESAVDAAALAQVRNTLGIIARMRGELDSAETSLRASLALADELGDLGAKVAALNNLSLALADREDYTAAFSFAEEALRLCDRIGDRHREAAIRNTLADLHHRSGRSDEAMKELTRAVAIFAEVGDPVETTQPEIWKLREW
jgi:predicted ATPase/DNA-binding SARP family transcriptional activator